MNEGFIRLSRSFFDHPLWKEPRPFSRAEAWLDLVKEAAFKDRKQMISGKMIDVPRGGVVASVRFLIERWKWSNTKVCQFLEMLCLNDMITTEKRQGTTVILLTNYERFNTDISPAKTTEKRQRNDAETTQKRRRNDETEEGKEGEEGKEIYPHAPKGADGEQDAFEQFWTAYPRKEGKGKARTIFQRMKCPASVEALIAAVERQKLSEQWRRDGGQYIPHPSTWLNQSRWEDEGTQIPAARKHRFDTP